LPTPPSTPSSTSPSHVVEIAFTARGTVDDFTLPKRTAVKTKFAAEAEVTNDRVTVDVVSASVRVTVNIAVASEARSSALVTSLSTKLADAQATTDFLGGDVEVESAPALRAVVVAGGAKQQQQQAQGGMPEGVLYGIIGGGVGALLIICLLVGYLLRRQAKRRSVYSPPCQLPNVVVKPQPTRDVASAAPRLVQEESSAAGPPVMPYEDAPPPKSSIEITPTRPPSSAAAPGRPSSAAAPVRPAPKLPPIRQGAPSHVPLRTHHSL